MSTHSLNILPGQGTTSPCSSCHAGCCRSFAVPVTGADILRIERDAGLSFEEFACRWADPDAAISRGMAPRFYFDDQPQIPFVICLRHESSVQHAGTTRCRFLDEQLPTADQPLGAARCSIYASRPAACRTFPTKFNATGELTVLYDLPPRGRQVDHPVYALCPRPWRQDEIDPLTGPQDLAVAKFEMEFFRSVARLWNQAPRPFDAFADFLRLVYRNRVLHTSTTVPKSTQATESNPRAA